MLVNHPFCKVEKGWLRTDLVGTKGRPARDLLSCRDLEHSPDALGRCILVVCRVLRDFVSQSGRSAHATSWMVLTKLHDDLLALVRLLRVGERGVHITERAASVRTNPDGPIWDRLSRHS